MSKRKQLFDADEMYWFARGYFDGRAVGAESVCRPAFSVFRSVYDRGYETGCTDYEEFELVDSNEQVEV